MCGQSDNGTQQKSRRNLNIIESARRKLGWLFAHYEELVIICVAVAIGCATGAGNIVFRSLITFFQKLFFGIESEIVLYGLKETPEWKIILVPALGGLIVGLITYFIKDARVHGVPEVIKAASLRRPIALSKGAVKTVTAAVTLGTGGSAGREGPIVLVGATIGSAIGQFFKFSSARTGTAIACGAAGGLAATFNAPMAGAMFAAEILLGEFGIRTFSPVIISAVTATVVSRAWYGNDVTFAAPDYTIGVWELPLYALLGVLIAFAAVVFIRSYYKMAWAFGRLNVPMWLKPAIGGLLMGVIAVFCRNIMGVGYGTINEILAGQITGFVLLLFVVLKILATSLTLGSGGSGGQLVPSLFIGAAAGGFFGWAVYAVFPGMYGSAGAFALVGMGAMLAAVIRAPITAIFMIFEITQNYHIVLPIMICAIIANVIANRIESDSIFTWSLSREGFKLGHGIEQNILSSIKVKDIMLTDIITFRDDTSFTEIKASIERKPHAYFPVVDGDNYLTGVISLNDLKNVIFKDRSGDEIKAGDIGIHKDIIAVSPEETLAEALQDFGIKEVGDLPVVERSDRGMKLLGLLRRSDIIIAYNKKMVDFSPRKED